MVLTSTANSYDELIPPEGDAIYVNRYGTVVMNHITLKKIVSGEFEADTAEAMEKLEEFMEVYGRKPAPYPIVEC